jgi:hypothetical protein
VALPAEPALIGRIEVVRRVAAHARSASPVRRRVRGRDAFMAARAGVDLRGWIDGMRLVARDARFQVATSGGQRSLRRTVLDGDIRVATSARLCRELGRVRRVASEARLVGVSSRSQKRLLGLVTAKTCARSAGDELVRLVAAQTGSVTRRLRDLLLRVATRAGGDSGDRKSMTAVAVETTVGSGMLCVLGCTLRMARRAGLRNDRRLAVQRVALCALGRRVHLHRGERPLGLGVARDALGGVLVGRELVTREAIGLVLRIPRVGVRGLLRVTLRANQNARVLEPLALEVVTPAARDLR